MSIPIEASFSGRVSAPQILNPKSNKVVSQGKKCDRVQLGQNLEELKIAIMDHKLYKKVPRSCFPSWGVYIQVKIDGEVGYLKVNAESLRKRLHVNSQTFKKWLMESKNRDVTQFVHEKLAVLPHFSRQNTTEVLSPLPFQVPRSIDALVDALGEALEMPAGEKKSAHIDQLMATCGVLFKGYASPGKVDELRALADCLESHSPEYAKALREYADEIHFPEDMMQQILNFITPKEALGFHAASKRAHSLAKQGDPRYPAVLRAIGIVTADGALKFAKRYGANLTYININNIPFNDLNKFEEFLKHLPKLERLDFSLSGIGITTADEALNFVKRFGATLTFINISNIHFDDAAKFEELLKHLPNLERLTAYDSWLGYNEIQVLKKYPPNKQLKELTFNIRLHGFDYTVTNPIIEGLAQIENLENLSVLNLMQSKISDPAIKAIAASPYLKNLRVLNLSSVDGLAKAAMPAIVTMSNLEELILSNSEDFDIEPFADKELMPNLRILDLAFGNISDEKFKMLAHLKLDKLNLQGQRKITDQALYAIMDGFDQLKELTITTSYRSQFSKEKIEELKKKRPDLKIIEK